MVKKAERLRIIANIKYELAEGTHTYTMCLCGRHGARSNVCWECYLDKLKDIKKEAGK